MAKKNVATVWKQYFEIIFYRKGTMYSRNIETNKMSRKFLEEMFLKLRNRKTIAKSNKRSSFYYFAVSHFRGKCSALSKIFQLKSVISTTHTILKKGSAVILEMKMNILNFWRWHFWLFWKFFVKKLKPFPGKASRAWKTVFRNIL